MPSTYKTPGVYIEEIATFPPSVAPVETAIPAFIGYTELAEKNGESLAMIPTRITSFLEFQQYFGGPPPRNIIVRLNAASQYLRTELVSKPYLLYDSLRLFYDNGGGICFIASVGDYTTPPDIGDINTGKGILGGLKALEKYDEPTLLLSPDAATLGTNLYSFQVQAINQCNLLQDRFLIADLLRSDEKVAGETHDERVADFRNNIGINYLKYAAAYTPWLRTSLQVILRFRDIIFAMDGDAAPTADSSLALLGSMTSSPNLLQLLFDLSNAIKVVNALNADLVPGGGGSLVDPGIADLDSQIKKLQRDYMAVYNGAGPFTFTGFQASLQAIYQRIADIILAVKTVNDALPSVVVTIPTPSATQTVEFKLKNDITRLQTQLQGILSTLVTHQRVIFKKSTDAGAPINMVISPDPKWDPVIAFANFANLAAIPNDGAVQAQYSILSIRIALMAQLLPIVNAAAAVAGAGPADVLAALVNVIPAADQLKTKVDAEINAAPVRAAANATAAVAVLDAKRVNVATLDADKVVLAIATAYATEDNNLNAPATTAALVPGPGFFPAAVATAASQIIAGFRQAATLAAANPGATAAGVAASFSTAPDPAKEFTLIAGSVAAGAGVAAIGYFNSVLNAASNYETVFDQSLMQTFGLYKTLVTKAGQDLVILPPGAGVAGVYASVDSNRGVWKAPANVSLASVLGPLTPLNAQDQESLNVDDNAGKSINVIRAFLGKGTLVWGSRTLAGNDNEWRYVPVRRYFNYAEESIRNASLPFVFEPNDANTWVRVKATIENFLTLEWRRGALAGAKATDAFYVRVGLGETMTAVDILEGRMIIEIGLAVVRPAEFIILRFAHKMQES